MIETLTLESNTRSAKRARAFIAAQLAGYDQGVVERSTLMLSELVTNSVKHATGTVTVTFEIADDRVHVEVRDVGPATVVLRSPSADDPTGRGLRIVADLSDEWGFESDDATGNRVWFVVRLDPASSPHASKERHSAHERAEQAGVGDMSIRTSADKRSGDVSHRSRSPGPPPASRAESVRCEQRSVPTRPRGDRTPSWRARRSGDHRAGVALGLAGGAIGWITGYLGGHMSFNLASGVGDRGVHTT